MPLVERMARVVSRGLPSHVERDDLVQDGVIGLIDAIIRTTRETAGVQFETYIAQRARGAMMDGLRAGDPGSRKIRREMRRVEMAIQKLGHALGRIPLEGEVAAELDLPLGQYQKLLQEAHGYHLISIDDLGGADDLDGYLTYCASSNEDPVAVLERAAFRRALTCAIEALPSTAQEVLQLYYGEELKMLAIGKVLGLTEARVSQLHSQAIAELRAMVVEDQGFKALLTPRRQTRRSAAEKSGPKPQPAE